MAQRLVLQRLLSLTLRTLPLQGQRTVSGPLALHGPLAPRGPLAPPGKAFGTSAGCRNTFNVQDGSDFQDRVVNNPKPVVVDFHAQWCGPCKILGPRLEKMVAKQEGKVLMAKVDIDDHTDLAIEYEDFLLGDNILSLSHSARTHHGFCLDRWKPGWRTHMGNRSVPPALGVSSANRAGYEERRCCG
ncbi:thioredoxin, mitochondrial isoform X1 [Numenius arquata]|uniref:thioredoxin, mitochondrial isoform X1 n=1 Tax=Numenius arquata TaxID=31919 RepID=UPI003D30ACBF